MVRVERSIIWRKYSAMFSAGSGSGGCTSPQHLEGVVRVLAEDLHGLATEQAVVERRDRCVRGPSANAGDAGGSNR